jgi:nucleoside-diphosphate-sugar epimerase
MGQVLVTGATGFIGGHLVRRLVERGDRVRCLIRGDNRRYILSPSAVEVIPGDITDPQALDPALRGVDTVYHLAGATLPLRTELYQRINVDGTRHLAESCIRQVNPPVLVYVSSLAAAGPTREDKPLTEEMPPQPVSAYGRSKLAAERTLRTLAANLPITVLRPPSVMGPGDVYVLKLFRLSRLGLALVPGRRTPRLSWIYVEDLVEAMILAAERGQRLTADSSPNREERGVYFVALDEFISALDLAALAAAVLGKRIRWTLHFPDALCRVVACFNDLRSRVTGRAYWVNADKITEALAGSWICSTEKAKRELGFHCRTDLTHAFHRTAQWYRAQGWL